MKSSNVSSILLLIVALSSLYAYGQCFSSQRLLVGKMQQHQRPQQRQRPLPAYPLFVSITNNDDDFNNDEFNEEYTYDELLQEFKRRQEAEDAAQQQVSSFDGNSNKSRRLGKGTTSKDDVVAFAIYMSVALACLVAVYYSGEAPTLVV